LNGVDNFPLCFGKFRTLVRARHAKAGASLFDANHGVAQIVVGGERGANQLPAVFRP